MNDAIFLQQAIEKAKESVAKGGFPAGAVVVKDGEVIGEGISIGNILHDPTSHGEMAAIRNACVAMQSSNLSECTLYASMQPCAMCLSASGWASISKIVYACPQEKVAKEYYGGAPVEMVHYETLERASLEVVKGWEDSLQ
ncbi:MAG TPA: nucleoside deaminase [Candidatus Paceibacterota bacterium]|nr:nucleoside deaminase [Candidatus Paceibacterota bacterium]